jgi:hypothetical protein
MMSEVPERCSQGIGRKFFQQPPRFGQQVFAFPPAARQGLPARPANIPLGFAGKNLKNEHIEP